VHIVAGFAAAPILLAKLWAVVPKLWERPAVRSLAHALERLSLALLVGGALFVFATGVFNIQIYYPWKFSFVPSHYWASFVFLGALGFHIALKLGVMRKAFRDDGVVAPLRQDLAHTIAEAPPASESVPTAPDRPTISRRGFVVVVGGTSIGLAFMMAAQSIGGPLRGLALLAPRGRDYGSGPNDFQINKTASSAGITPTLAGPFWTLALTGSREKMLNRAQLLQMKQSTHDLPIACVEGWTTTQSWTRRAAARPGPAGRCGRGRHPARRVAAGSGLLPRRRADAGADRRPALAARAEGQRGRPVDGPRLPGADHRAGAARRAQHEVGRQPDLPERVSDGRFRQAVRRRAAASAVGAGELRRRRLRGAEDPRSGRSRQRRDLVSRRSSRTTSCSCRSTRSPSGSPRA